jgi:hypothetical protein
VTQDFDDFEVVVSDNSQSSVAGAFVSGLGDSRIKLVRTPRAMSMADSWNFAIAHTQGEYATLLGDDDGLLLHALSELDQLVTKLSPQIVRYETVHYWWPNVPPTPGSGLWQPNVLLVPLLRTDANHTVRVVSGRESIAQAVSFHNDKTPSIRCAMVHRSLIEELRTRTGAVFQAEAPDAYSAFALAAVADEIHCIDAPMDIKGYSGDSTYLGVVSLKGRSTYAKDFEQLNAASMITRHPDVPRLPTITALFADAFLQAKAALFPLDDELVLNKEEATNRYLKESRPDDEREWKEILGIVGDSLVTDPDLTEWFDARWSNLALEDHLESLRSEMEPSWTFKRYTSQHLKLDASQFGVTNVCEAAELVEKLLGYRSDGVRWQLAPLPASTTQPSTAFGRWLQQRWHGFLTMTGLMGPYVRLRKLPRDAG